MKRLVPLICSLLLSCTKPTTAPATPVDAVAPVTSRGTEAAAPDAGAIAPDAGTGATAQTDAGTSGAPTARCSASNLSPEPKPTQPPVPEAVDSMRRRIIAAAVACDYEGLAALTREKDMGFKASFGDVTDVAGYWRELETSRGQPVLAQMVKLLNLPYAKLGDLYVWPSVHRENATDEDWKAVEAVYPPKQLAEMRRQGTGYLGLRLGILSNGHWQFSLAGD
ncbi:hypothetical protein [Archangium violaceum]